MSLNINYQNRQSVPITDFEFLSLFKTTNERIYFRFIHEKKHFAKKDDCILTLQDDFEYPLMQKIFQKYQKQGYGIYFVVNSGGHTKDSIKRINAHFIDMDFGKVPKVANGKIVKDSQGKTVYVYRSREEIEYYKIAFLKKLKKFELCPNIIVETKNGFHVYWLLDLDKPQQLEIFTPLQEKLIEYFASIEERKEHADKSVKDINRVLRLINYNHLKNPNEPFKIKCIFLDESIKYTQENIASAIGFSITELIKGIKNTKTKPESTKSKGDILQNKIRKVYYSTDIQYEDLIPFLKQQDLTRFLGINVNPNVNFKCIFHNDSNPSAVISDKNGYFRYFCNSPTCICHNNSKGVDIIDIVKIKENCSTSSALKKLIKYYKINLKDSTWINRENKRIETNIILLSQLKSRKEQFPNLNRIIRFGYPLLIAILEICKENITNRFFSIDGESIFFFSNRYLAKKTNKSVVNINKYINLFCTLGLLKKIPYEKVNEYLKATAIEISKNNGYNGISFYTVPNYDRVFKTADERAAVMLKYRFSINGMSKKYLEGCFGEEFANQIYLVNVKDSERSRKIRNAIEIFILKQIKTYGYCTKDMVMDYQLRINNNYIKRGVKEYEFRKVLPDIIQKYDLVYIKANKNINKRLNIETKKYLIIQSSLLEQ